MNSTGSAKPSKPQGRPPNPNFNSFSSQPQGAPNNIHSSQRVTTLSSPHQSNNMSTGIFQSNVGPAILVTGSKPPAPQGQAPIGPSSGSSRPPVPQGQSMGGSTSNINVGRPSGINNGPQGAPPAPKPIGSSPHSVKETKDVKRNFAQLPTNMTHMNPTKGDWLNKRYIVNNYILLDVLGTGSYGEVNLIPLTMQLIFNANFSHLCQFILGSSLQRS
jgi:hypothetical protein